MKQITAITTHTAMAMKAAGAAALVLLLTSCGGGGIGSGPSVNTLSASTTAYSRTTTVTVSGSRLDDSGLTMTVDGPCVNIAKGSASDFQATFTCLIDGVGEIVPRVRNGNGLELARLRLTVLAPQVTMTVTQGTRTGSFVLELDPAAAPVTARNFMAYVNAAFYTGTLFHRVVAGQLAQGGGYTTGPTAKAATRPAIVLESNNGLKNLRGTIAMARTSVADSATSQFFLNLADNPAFDRIDASLPGYAVFGRVVSGQEVVDEIGKVPVQTLTSEFSSLPTEEVVMTSVVQTR